MDFVTVALAYGVGATLTFLLVGVAELQADGDMGDAMVYGFVVGLFWPIALIVGIATGALAALNAIVNHARDAADRRHEAKLKAAADRASELRERAARIAQLERELGVGDQTPSQASTAHLDLCQCGHHRSDHIGSGHGPCLYAYRLGTRTRPAIQDCDCRTYRQENP